MSIPYRTQQKLKRLSIALLILLVVAAIIWGLWVIWLQRYVVYTRTEGAIIDFEQPQTLPVGEMAVQPEAEPVEIYYNEGDNKINVGLELTQINGYYVTLDDLEEDVNLALEQIRSLPTNGVVMLELKNIYGEFYYNTNIGRPKYDTGLAASVDQIISELKRSGMYTIACVPALQDRAYGLDYSSNGLPLPEGYLWVDEYNCYWLDPTKEGTMSYLLNIAKELQALGFDEVVFEKFCFPDTDEIVFEGDRKQALEEAAQTLVNNGASNAFAVSFVSDGSWTAPTGRSRIYRDDISNPVELMALVNTLTIEDPAIHMVFVTNNTDARFDEYSVLRPINLIH